MRRATMPGGRCAVLVGMIGAFLSGCHGPATPEDQVRAVLARAQQAVAETDLGVMTEMISDRYGDEVGRDRSAIVALLRTQFIENQSIHLLTRVQEVRVRETGRAEVGILVAAGATTLPEQEEELSTLKADLYRFEIVLAEEEPGRWRVMSATWRRVGAGGLM